MIIKLFEKSILCSYAIQLKRPIPHQLRFHLLYSIISIADRYDIKVLKWTFELAHSNIKNQERKSNDNESDLGVKTLSVKIPRE